MPELNIFSTNTQTTSQITKTTQVTTTHTNSQNSSEIVTRKTTETTEITTVNNAPTTSKALTPFKLVASKRPVGRPTGTQQSATSFGKKVKKRSKRIIDKISKVPRLLENLNVIKKTSAKVQSISEVIVEEDALSDETDNDQDDDFEYESENILEQNLLDECGEWLKKACVE